MMKAKTYGVVVTFNPDQSVVKNIRGMLEQVSRLVIVDNQSSQDSQALLSSLSADSRVSIIYNPVNEGVAKAFNQGLKVSYDEGAEYFILFDQDSSPQDGMVDTLIARALSNVNRLAIFGPILIDRVTGRADIKPKCLDPICVDLLISSGSLFSRAVIDKIGFMDEKLFIDYVDHDYCLRLKALKGGVWRVPQARMLHSFGDAYERVVFGRRIFVHNYSAKRRYYMARNRVVVYRRHAQFDKSWLRDDFVYMCKDLVKMVMFEGERVEKMGAIIKGFIAGVRW